MRDTTKLVSYCVSNDLFTGGDISQYLRVQALYSNGKTNLHDIACMVWICSHTEKSIEEIQNDLEGLE